MVHFLGVQHVFPRGNLPGENASQDQPQSGREVEEDCEIATGCCVTSRQGAGGKEEVTVEEVRKPMLTCQCFGLNNARQTRNIKSDPHDCRTFFAVVLEGATNGMWSQETKM